MIYYYIWRDLGAFYKELPNFVTSQQLMENIPCLRGNPWGKRIIRLFADYTDPASGISIIKFENFLDMISAFNLRSPKYVKCYYMFRLYDFDDDGELALAEEILNECDIDGSHR
eukprot:UN21964